MRTPSAAVVLGTWTAWAAALEGALLIKEIARIPCEGVETQEGATAAMTSLNATHLVLTLPTPGDDFIVEAEEICRARGAQVLQAPGVEADRRVSPITAFPAPLALSVALALRAGSGSRHSGVGPHLLQDRKAIVVTLGIWGVARVILLSGRGFHLAKSCVTAFG